MDAITQAAINGTELDDGMDALDREDAGIEEPTPEQVAEDQKEPGTEEAKEEKADAEAQPEEEGADETPPAIVSREEFDKLQKDAKAYFKGMEDERGKRQQLEGRLAQFNDFMAKVRAEREEVAAPIEKPKFKGFRVEMTEDGDAYVPEDQLAEFFKNQLKPIESTISTVTAKTQARDNKQIVNDLTSQIMAEDAAYPTAYKAVLSTWQDLVGIVADQNGGKLPPMATEPMLKTAMKPAVRKAFLAKHPEVSMTDLIVTFTEADPEIWTDGLRDLLKANVPHETPAAEEKPKGNQGLNIKQQKAIAGKAKSPGVVRGAIGPQPTELERVFAMGTRAFMKEMDDKKLAALDKLLEEMEAS